MERPKYRVCVLDAGKKGYAVGIYSTENSNAVFDSSSHEARFPQVISKLAKLAQKHPEAFHEISIHLGPGKDFQEGYALAAFQETVYSFYTQTTRNSKPELAATSAKELARDRSFEQQHYPESDSRWG